MATTVSINSSDWVDMRTRGFSNGMYFSNKVGPAIEYSRASVPSPATTFKLEGNALQFAGLYLWVRGCGDVELYTLDEAVQRSTVREAPVRALYNSALPRVTAPSGIATAGGTITFNATVFGAGGSGPMFVYLPANVVFGDAVGGWYYGNLSGGTTFTISPAVSTVAGAYTQTSSLVTFLNVVIPAGEMGLHGGVRITQMYQCIGSANTKVVQSKFGTQLFGANTTFGASQTTQGYINTVRNTGVANRQTYSNVVSDIGSATSAVQFSTQDTSAPVTIAFTGQLNAPAVAANEWLGLTGCTVELIEGVTT